MNLLTEPYLAEFARWPQSGRHSLAQFDADSIIVYQAYRPSIGHWTAEHGAFGGGGFNFERMSWVRPNFLWAISQTGGSTWTSHN